MTDPYLSENRCIQRLFNNYKDHNNLLVAFDFDDTIFDYHKNGFTYTVIINLLLECQELGMILVLFTGNEGENLDRCLSHCKTLGLNIKYANESPLMPENRKPFYNILLDDRAGLGQSYYILTETIKLIKRSKKNDSATSL